MGGTEASLKANDWKGESKREPIFETTRQKRLLGIHPK